MSAGVCLPVIVFTSASVNEEVDDAGEEEESDRLSLWLATAAAAAGAIGDDDDDDNEALDDAFVFRFSSSASN